MPSLSRSEKKKRGRKTQNNNNDDNDNDNDNDNEKKKKMLEGNIRRTLVSLLFGVQTTTAELFKSSRIIFVLPIVKIVRSNSRLH